MATFHPPHSAGPGTYLELPDFKAYYGEDWKVKLEEFQAKLKFAQKAWGDAYKASPHKYSEGFVKSFPGANKYSSAIVEAKKYLPYTPPKGWQVALSKVATTTIKTVATGAFAGAAAGLGQNAANSILGKDSMGFIDDIGAQFDQVSSLVKKGEGLYKQAKNFGGDYGNAGSTGIGTPAAAAPTATNSGGIPGWVFVVGGVALAWVLLRK